MAFDRNKAVNYADAHWNIPSGDGIIALANGDINIPDLRIKHKAPVSEGWQPFFVEGAGEDIEIAVFRRTVGGVTEDKLINGWAGLADCAHFLSQCLTAGGVVLNERVVAPLVAKLQARADTKLLCERVPREAGQRVVDSGIFKPGDMIGYWNIDPKGDYGGARAYAHSTMYVGKIDKAGIGGVTCHTVARFPPRSWKNDSWWLHTGYVYTLIHFTVDDPVVSAAQAADLEGWWQLDYMARREYYYVFKDGRARYTKRAPKSKNEQLYAGDGSAHWFLDPSGKVTFIWKATGTVEVWTPGVGARSYKSLINGSTPGTLVSLF